MKIEINERQLSDCLVGIEKDGQQQQQFNSVFAEIYEQIEALLFILTSAGWSKSTAMLVLGRLFNQFGDALIHISKTQKQEEERHETAA